MKTDTCIHQKLCKHFQEDEMATCGIREVCKYFTESFLSGTVTFEGQRIDPVQNKKRNVKADDDLLTTFRKAKVFITLHKEKLNENQQKAVASMQGKHYSSLSKEQRDQLIGIAADLERIVKGVKENKI